MKKLLSLSLVGTTLFLAACVDRPSCQNADMDNCGFGTVYSEERTATGEKKTSINKAEPTPVAAAPTPPPAPAPVAEPEPQPEPAPVTTDSDIMGQAEEPSQNK